MKILFDLQSCQSGSRLGGIGRYTLSLVRAMARKSAPESLTILLNNRLPESVAEIRRDLSDYIPQKNIISFESLAGVSALQNTPGSSKVRSAELLREHFISQLAPDAVLLGSLFEGLADDIVTSIPKAQTRTVQSVILYDLIPYVNQDMYLTEAIIKQHYMSKIRHLNNADLLLAISDFSRSEGVRLLDLPREQVVNISSASDAFFKKISVTDEQRISIQKQFNLSGSFLIYTSSFDARKNQRTLIEAFARLPTRIKNKFQLLIVGNGWPDVYQTLKRVGKDLGLADDRIIFAGKVTDEQLLLLYNMAYLMVFPSLYEGFGLPILEAMSCGTPAIGSNSSSIIEVIGTNSALFDPNSPGDIAKKIVQVIDDPNFRERLKIHASEHIKNFSWERSADIALNSLGESIQRKNYSLENAKRMHSFPQASLVENLASFFAGSIQTVLPYSIELVGAIRTNEHLSSIANCSRRSKLCSTEIRLGLVSTWNTKCGIAAYAKLLMFDWPGPVNVFAPKSDSIVEPDEAATQRCWSIGEKDELTELKRAILESGVNTILIQFHYGFYSFQGLINLISDLIASNITVAIQLHSTADPPEHILPKKLKTLAEALKSCSDVFVLSRRDLLTLHGLGVTQNVRLMPLGVPRITKLGQAERLFQSNFIISSYGYFLPHKGLIELIEGFAIVKRSIKDAKLILVNSEYPADVSSALIAQAKDLVKTLGLSEDVRFITDYLSDEQSCKYLKGTDLVVFAYQNTTEPVSAAVRLGITSGVPVCVTPGKIFGEVKHLTHTLPGFTPNEIASGILAIHERIKTSSPAVVEMLQSCKLWIANNSYSNLTEYLTTRLLISRLVTDASLHMQQWPATGGLLRSQIGLDDGTGKISSEGKSGVLLHGPYVDLAIGQYTISIVGECDRKTLHQPFDVRLSAGGGSQLIEMKVHELECNAIIFEASFSITAPVAAFECVVIAAKGFPLSVSDVILTSRNRIA